MASLDHTPLDLTRLSPAVQKALGPGPARMMAARGLVPMPRPGELLTVLYQLAHDGDAGLAAAAKATADGLPEKVLAGGLADTGLDPRVLDWVAAKVADRAALHDLVVANPATADQTIASLAAHGGAREVDLIAHNEQRLLRHPEIIGAMYINPKARMSTVDRAVELAVRNQIRVPGLAAWDEIARALSGAGGRASTQDDATFAQAAAGLAAIDDSALTSGDAETFQPPEGGPEGEEAEVDEAAVPVNKLSIPSKVRLATLGNAVARNVLIRDPIKMVAMAAIKAPGVTEIEAARYAGNHSLADDVIRYIATRREWTKMYGVKVSLVMNPKTPIAESARLMPHLREKDLRNVAKSRGVPSAVVAQARKLMSQRSTGGSGGRH